MPPRAIELCYLVAIAYVWSRGSLFRWLRTHGPAPWIALADCPLCSGFWIGVIGHAIYLDAPLVVVWLGTGSIVGTCALAVFGIIRRL